MGSPVALTADRAPALLRPEWLLLGATVLWGTSWLPLHYFSGQSLAGVWVIAVSYGLAGFPAVYFLWRERQALVASRLKLLLITAFGSWGNIALMLSLSQSENIVRLMLLFYLTPVWGALGGYLFLRERIDTTRIAAVAFALAGAAILLGADSGVLSPLSGYDLLALSGGIAFTLANIATRSAVQIPLASKSFTILLGSAVLALCLIPAHGAPAPEFSLRLFALLLGFGLLWILTATLAAQYAISRMDTGKASILLISELIVAVISAAVLGEKALSPREWTGAAFVILAAALETYAPHRKAGT